MYNPNMKENRYRKVSDYTEDQNEIIGAFVKLIKTNREAQGLSVRELGAMANVSYTVIYDLENKNILPKLETINKLANALGLFIDVKQNESALYLLYSKEDESGLCNHLGQKIIRDKATSKEEDLKKILTKYGLYNKDIDEVENFIKFKLSQH